MRVGIFGGTFNPIHNSHLDVAKMALNCAKLDKLIFVVSARPPHKFEKDLAPAEDRYNMVKLAIQNEPKMDVSRIELDRDGQSYTCDTLIQFQNLYPNSELYLVLGGDSLIDIPNWKSPDIIRSMSTLLVIPRPGVDIDSRYITDRCVILKETKRGLSATEIRNRVLNGISIKWCVSNGVMEYIKAKRLYSQN